MMRGTPRIPNSSLSRLSPAQKGAAFGPAMAAATLPFMKVTRPLPWMPN